MNFYEHPGGAVSSNGGYVKETSCRRQAAMSTPHMIGKNILKNKAYKDVHRLHIAATLVQSRLYYNAATWCGATGHQLKSIDNVV